MRAIELPVEQWRELDRVVAEFEASWLSGEQRSISETVDGSQLDREVLLPELVHGEIECRLRRGEDVDVDEYFQRFPELARDPNSHAELMATVHEVGETLNASITRTTSTIAIGDLPQDFGRYQLQELLGQGAMGAVYRAFDTELERDVAVKLTFRTASDDIERFRREARAAAGVKHRNVCGVLDFGLEDGVYFIAMELLVGQTLADHARDNSPVLPITAAKRIRAIAKGLHALHERGIVHRDLKPANIVIDSDGEPVVTDFGLAKPYVGDAAGLTATGASVGTPAYMSPEQITAASEIGPESDVFSLGVVFYELLTGERPFQGNPFSVMRQIVEEHPTQPRAIHKDIDPMLERICLRMLARRREDRFSSMQEVVEALDGFLQRNRESEQETTGIASARILGKPMIGVTFMLAIAAIVFGVVVVIKTGGHTVQVKEDDGHVTVAVNGNELSIGEQSSKDADADDAFVNSIGMQFARVPAGSFLMGSPLNEPGRFDHEGPQKEVTITRPFLMGKYEVTVAQFKTFAEDIGHVTAAERPIGDGRKASPWTHDLERHPDERNYQDAMLNWKNPGFPQKQDQPVVCITWYDAVAFCRWLSEREGKSYRLPTEAEWEYACRAGSTTPFHFGDCLSSSQANFYWPTAYPGCEKHQPEPRERTVPVGSYAANAFGLHNMHGNVMEYTADWYESRYSELPEVDPKSPPDGVRTHPVVRGGAWHFRPEHCRSANRFAGPSATSWPDQCAAYQGFRVACELK